MTDIYSKALKCAREKMESFQTTSIARSTALTDRQLSAVRAMIADAYICGWDAHEESTAQGKAADHG